MYVTVPVSWEFEKTCTISDAPCPGRRLSFFVLYQLFQDAPTLSRYRYCDIPIIQYNANVRLNASFLNM
jgi:hypothetical protein